MNRQFSKEDIQMDRCSDSLVIGEMQIGAPMRCYFTLTKMAIKKKTNNKAARRWWLMPVILATQEAEIRRIEV
jgi:hypothetical protein